MTALKNIGMVIGIILAIDFTGFIGWVISGQFPPDNFYVGVITNTIIKLIFN